MSFFTTTVDRANLDDRCGMRLWYAHYQGGNGITANKDVIPNAIVEATYSDLREISLMEDISKNAIQAMIDEILVKLTPDQHRDIRAKELLYRRLGWAAAYALFVEPQIRKLYKTLPIPESVDLHHDPLIVRIKTGRLLLNRHTNEVEHRDIQLTSSNSLKWRESVAFSIGPHLAASALAIRLGRRVHAGRVMGLATGFFSTHNGMLHHPYVYGFKAKDSGEWTHSFRQDGWEERPVWEYPYSITDWVLKGGLTMAENQFPLSSFTPVNQPMLTNWLEHRLHRERTIHQMKGASHHNVSFRNLHFPRRTAECAPIHTAACPFKNICWSQPFMANAQQMVNFVQNTPIPLSALSANRTLSEELEAAMSANLLDRPVIDLTPLPAD